MTRPSLVLFGVAGTRLLALSLAATAIVGTAIAVSKPTSALAGIALVAPMFLTSDLVDIGESAAHALSYASCWASAWFAWSWIKRRPDITSIAMVGVLAGALAAFLDLMVLIPGTLALVSTLVMVALWAKGWDGRRLFLAGLTAAITWFLGFAITWATKWALAGFVVGFGQVADNIRSQVSFRLAGDHAEVIPQFGRASWVSIEYWLDRPLGIIIPIIVLLCVALAIRGIRKHTIQPLYLLALTGLTLVPFVWYEALSSHTQIHFWITYKSMPIALGALLYALTTANLTKA